MSNIFDIECHLRNFNCVLSHFKFVNDSAENDLSEFVGKFERLEVGSKRIFARMCFQKLELLQIDGNFFVGDDKKEKAACLTALMTEGFIEASIDEETMAAQLVKDGIVAPPQKLFRIKRDAYLKFLSICLIFANDADLVYEHVAVGGESMLKTILNFIAQLHLKAFPACKVVANDDSERMSTLYESAESLLTNWRIFELMKVGKFVNALEEFYPMFTGDDYLRSINPSIDRFGQLSIESDSMLMIVRACGKQKQSENASHSLLLQIILEATSFDDDDTYSILRGSCWSQLITRAWLLSMSDTEPAAQWCLRALDDPILPLYDAIDIEERFDNYWGKGVRTRPCALKDDEGLEVVPEYKHMFGKLKLKNPREFRSTVAADKKTNKGNAMVEMVTNGPGGIDFNRCVGDAAGRYYKFFWQFERCIHDEGACLKSICGLLLWRVIYSPSITFQSQYQTHPNDLYSSRFIPNRQKEFDQFKVVISAMNRKELVEYFKANFNLAKSKANPFVDWMKPPSNATDINFLSELIECVSPREWVQLIERLFSNFAHFQDGFPNLLLWRKQILKLVQVKVTGFGNPDRFSVKQRLWMDALPKMGFDAEICLVKCGVAIQRLKK